MQMNTFALELVRRAVLITGLGAVLVSLSEYWFYNVSEDVDSALILLAYGLLGYLVMAVVQRYHVHSLAGAVFAAALFGFLVEGVPVPVLYSNPPFSIIWTSLAWHGVITIGFGWALYRYVMINWRAWSAAAFNIGLGVFLGAWNSFMWNANEAKEGSEIVFDWQPIDAFLMQFLFGYALFLGGHVMLDRLYPKALRIKRGEEIALWIFVGAVSISVAYASGLLALFAVLPVLVVLCLLALRTEARNGSKETIVERFYKKRIPIWRFGLSVLIPIFAIGIYTALVASQIELEANTIVILTAGPASLVALIWALVSILFRLKRSRKPT